MSKKSSKKSKTYKIWLANISEIIGIIILIARALKIFGIL
jgi:hypothetical protein